MRKVVQLRATMLQAAPRCRRGSGSLGQGFGDITRAGARGGERYGRTALPLPKRTRTARVMGEGLSTPCNQHASCLPPGCPWTCRQRMYPPCSCASAPQCKRRWRLMLKCVPDHRNMEFDAVLMYLVDKYAPKLRQLHANGAAGGAGGGGGGQGQDPHGLLAGAQQQQQGGGHADADPQAAAAAMQQMQMHLQGLVAGAVHGGHGELSALMGVGVGADHHQHAAAAAAAAAAALAGQQAGHGGGGVGAGQQHGMLGAGALGQVGVNGMMDQSVLAAAAAAAAAAAEAALRGLDDGTGVMELPAH